MAGDSGEGRGSASSSDTPGGAASKYAYSEELVTPEATAAAAAALQTMRDSSDLMGRLRPLKDESICEDEVVAAAERMDPSLWDVCVELFKDDFDNLRERIRDGTVICYTEFVVSQLLNGQRGRPDGGYGCADRARTTALFASGGLIPFVRAARVAASAAVEAAVTRPRDQDPGGSLHPVNVIARSLLRWACMAMALEDAAKAGLNSHQYEVIHAEVKLLLDTVSEGPPHATSSMEGLVNQMVAMMDHWCQAPGVLPQPRKFQDSLGMSEMAAAKYEMMAVPMAEAMIAKGANLSIEEANRVMMAAMMGGRF